MLEPDPETCELTLTRVHPGVTVDAGASRRTGWPLRVADDLVIEHSRRPQRELRRCARCAPQRSGSRPDERPRRSSASATAPTAPVHPPVPAPRLPLDAAAGAAAAAAHAARGAARPDGAGVRRRAASAESTPTSPASTPASRSASASSSRAACSTATAGRCRDALVEIWQANAAGRYRPRASTSTRRRSTRTSPAPAAASPTTTAATGSSRSSPAPTRGATTRTPGGPAHIHFSLFGRAFTERLVTQMYFPGDPLFAVRPDLPVDPRPARARAADLGASTSRRPMPEWALGFRFDIVLGGRDRDADRGLSGWPRRRRRRPSGRSSRSGCATRPQHELVDAGARRARSASAAACSTARASRCPTRWSRSGSRRRAPAWRPLRHRRRRPVRLRHREAAAGAGRRRTSRCSSSRAAC